MVHRRLAAIAAIFSSLAATDCQRPAPEQTRNAVAPAPAASVPLPVPKLDREHLILAAMRSLSAAALGQDDKAAQRQLDGREFELRMRFGCPGFASGPSRGWSYDPKEQVLRAHISADLSANGVPASDLLLKGYEGVAGFVVERPMLLSAGCPAPQFGAMSAGEPTIALAQLFTSDDSRVQRPESSYQITKAIEETAKPAKGLDLVIAGRLTELKDRRVIHCAAMAGPPACIVAARFDRVAIENPADGSVLGEWSNW